MRSSIFVRGLIVLWLAGGGALPAAAQTLEITTPEDMGRHAVGPLHLALHAQGGTPPYTWAATTLPPPGTAVHSNVPAWMPPDIAATLSGVPTLPGNYTFTLSVTDSTSFSVSRTFTLSIGTLVVTDGYDLPSAFVGEPYHHTFSTLGAFPGVTFGLNSPLPSGLSLSLAGELTGTPAGPGSHQVHLFADDGFGRVNRGFNLRVFGVRITTPGLLPNATPGAAYATSLTATGGVGAHTWSAWSMPGGLSLAPDGTVSGTLPFQGTYQFTATVTDGTGQSHDRSFAVVAVPSPVDLPRLHLSGLLEDFITGEAMSRSFQAGGGVPPYTWMATGLPPGLALRVGEDSPNWWVRPTDVEVVGTLATPGPHTFTLSVTDSALPPITVTREITLRASELAYHYFNASGAVGSPLTFVVDAFGGQAPYAAVQVGETLPTGVIFNGATMTFSGTPLEPGGYHPLIRISDAGGRTLLRRIHLFISGGVHIGTHPQLQDATRDQAYFTSLWASGTTGAPAWSLESGALPPGLTLDGGGAITGVPTVSGTFHFRVRVTDTVDAGNTAARDMTLVVTPVRMTMSFTLTPANVGTFYGETLTATGGATGYTWSVDPDSVLPLGLTLSPGGILSGVPASAGLFQFRVLVHDSLGQPASAWLTLAIYPAGFLPTVSINNGPHLGTWVLGWSELELRASGGDDVYEWQLVSGALPPGVAIRTDGPSWFDVRSSGLIGILTTPGDYAFTLSVTSAGQTVTRAFTMTVSPLMILDSYTLPDAFVDAPYSYTFTTSSSGAPMWTLQPGSSLPSGLVLDPSGVLSGTPTTPGFYNPHFKVTDGADVAFRGFSVTVWDIRITTPGLLLNGTQNTPYPSIQFEAEGGTGVYTWSGQNLPFGLTLSPSGLLSGTPTSPATFGFSVTATDAGGRFYTKRFTLNVVGVPPVLPNISTSFDLTDMTVGQSSAYGFWVHGGTAPYTWSVLNPPPGMALRTTHGSTWLYPEQSELWGAVATPGTYSFDISVTDSASPPVTVTRTYTVHVSRLAISWEVPSGTMGMPLSGRFRVLGGTGPYTVVLASGKLPAGITLATDGTLSGTPLEGGSFGFRLIVTDSAGETLYAHGGMFIGTSGDSTVQINSHYLLNMTAGVSTSRTLSACCLPGYAWALEPGATLPPGLSFSTGGVLSGTPTTPGEYPFMVRVFDPTFPANFQVREFVAVVTALNLTAPFSLPFDVVGNVYPSTTFTVSGAVGPVTWHVRPDTALPLGLSLSPTGVLTGTPLSAGQYNFTVEATDGTGPPLSRSFSLTIYPTGGGPPLSFFVPSPITVRLGRFVTTLNASGGVPPYAYALSPGAPAIPGLRVQGVGQLQPAGFPATFGSFIGVTTAPGSYATSLRVTDSVGTTFDRALTINVPATLVVGGPLPSAYVGLPYAHTLMASGGTGPYLWTLSPFSSPPAGLSLSPAGVVTWTPPAGAPGNVSLSVVATNSGGVSSTTTGVSFAVYPFEIATDHVLPDATEGTGYSIALTAPGCMVCQWTAIGSLPPGLALSSDGVVSGTAPSYRVAAFTIEARDTSVMPQAFSRKLFLLHVLPASPQPVEFQASTLADAVVGQHYSAALSVRAGLPPYTVSITGGALPEGLRLVDGAQLHAATVAGVTWVGGAPVAPGTYAFTAHAEDATGASTSRAFTLVVSPVNIEYTFLPVFGTVLRYNELYSQGMLAVGGTPPYTWTALTPMPPGLTLSGSGVVAGTPVNTGGFSAQFRATDAVGQALTRFVNFNISSGTAATLGFALPGHLGTFELGVSNYIVLNGAGSPLATPDYVFSVPAGFSLPPGFELRSGAGLPPGAPEGSTVLAFTPEAIGPVDLTLRVDDAAGNFGVRTFSMTVTAPVCVFTLGSTSATIGSGGGPGSIGLTASAGCGWTATSGAPWISVTTPSGTGSATVGYAVDPNPDASARTGVVTVGGQAFTITQFGSACAIVVDPASVFVPAGGSTAALWVVTSGAGCTWSATSSAPWLHIVSGGSGTGTGVLNISIDASASPGVRGATIDIAGDAVASATIAQAGIDCGVTLGTSSLSVPAAGGSGVVDVTLAPCGYVALAPPQVTITSGASSAGTGTVQFTVGPNTGTTPRALTLQIGGTPFAITQAGVACTISLGGSLPIFEAAGGSGALTVTAGSPSCEWTVGGGASWITVTGGSPGTGSGTVTFTVDPHGDAALRAAGLSVGGQTVQVQQAGTVCEYTLRSALGTMPASGGAGSAGVLAATSCAWSAVSHAPWLTVTGSDSAGTGFMHFDAQPNPSASPRTGTLTVAGLPYTVTQSAASCAVTLQTPGASVSAAGASGSVPFTVSASGCALEAQSYSDWLSTTTSTSGTGGTVAFTVAPNLLNAPRTGRFVIGDAVFTVRQDASVGCAYSLAAYGAGFAQPGGDGDVLASGSALGCAPAVGSSPEITLGLLSFADNIFTQPYTVAPYVSSVIWVRTLHVNFGGVTFTVKQTSW